MALAGPPKEKPHLTPTINAGTAEPMGVSPPEAVAYQVLVITTIQLMEAGPMAEHLNVVGIDIAKRAGFSV